MPRLSDSEIADRLKTVPEWARDGDRIRREFVFPTFPDAVAFIVRVGFEAEAVDHHPDIHVHYRRVTLVYWTHSEGGLTQKDFDGAAAADRIAAAMSRTAPAETAET
ncbi:MAG TPA: 4a-hydroxytetrahydrobiopterin dehydratase [Vicinamibacterales bacterium]